MVRLRLLGGLGAQAEGASLDPEQHRKTLMVLAVVAAAGDGISRDKLLAHFWPESDAERARNALRQRLFALRRQLGSGDLFIGTTEIRLNPAVVTSDLAEFDSAIAAGDVERAADLYTGPLLDGVHTHGAPELGHWIEAQRGRVAARAGEALKSAAKRATARGAHAEAARRWRQLLALDAANANSVLGLLGALDDAGDTAAALQQAQLYETLMRVEYGAEPDLRVMALAEAIRKGERKKNGVAGPEPPVLSATPQAMAVVTHSLPPRPRRAVSLRWIGLVGVGVAMLVAASAAVLGGSWGESLASLGVRPTTKSSTLDRTRVVVAAFDPVGVATDTLAARVEQLTRDWLTRGLLQTGLVTVIPAGALVDDERARRGADDLRPLLNAARSARAGLLVTGTHYSVGDSLFLTARVTDVASGAVYRAIGPVGGRRENDLHAIEQLRQRLMATLAMGVDERMINWSTAASQPSNFEAYRAFADGLGIFFNGPPSSDPFPHFRRAHALDTSFVTPLLWLFFDRGRALPGEDSTLKAYLSTRRDRLAPWDQGLLDWALKKNNEEGYQAFRRVVQTAPQSEWLYMLGYTAMATNRPATVKRALRLLDPNRGWIRDWPSYWTLLADAHHFLGEHHDELEVVRRGRERFPVNGQMVGQEIRALAALAEKGALEDNLAEITYASPRFSHFPSFEWLLRELRRHGQTEAANSLGERLRKEIEASHALLNDSAKSVRLRLGILSALTRWDEAAVIIDSLSSARSSLSEETATLRLRALIAASRGQRDSSHSIANRLWEMSAQRPLNGSLYWATTGHIALQASIEAHLGFHAEAVSMLQRGMADRVHPVLLHISWSLEPLYDDPRYVELASRRYDDPEVLRRP